VKIKLGQALQQGVAAHREGKLEDARRFYHAILRVQPDHPDANHNLGVLAVSAGDFQAAIPLFQLALQKNPDLEQFWLSYIDALIRLERIEEVNAVLASEARSVISAANLVVLQEQLQDIGVIKHAPKISSRERMAHYNETDKNKKDNQLTTASRPSQEQITTLFELHQAGRWAEAEELAVVLTGRFPENSFAWKVLGSVLQKQSRLDEALIAKQQVLDNALQESCRFKEAEKKFRRAIELNAEYAEAYSNLGNTLRSLDRFEEAISACAQAIALKPDYAPAHCNMANALKELERFDEAAASYKRAVAIDAKYAIAFNNLGVALQELGRLTEAEAAYAQAVSLEPTLAAAYNNLATAQIEMGKPDSAKMSYARAMKLAPNSAEVLRNYTNAGMRLDLGSEPVKQMQEVYRDPNITADDRCQICFALAKVFQDLEDFESAFKYFAEGNALRKDQLGYDIKADIELFSDLKANYSKMAVQLPLRNAEGDTPIPIFIVGMPRSGTTLVEQIISSHPQVTGAGELPFVSKFGGRLASGLMDLDQESLWLFREQYLSALGGVAEGNVLVTDKMPQNFRFLGLISLALPEAKIIHVRRDPAAVCWANYTQYFSRRSLGYLYSMEDILSYYQLYQDLMDFWEQSLSMQILEADYERLTVNQEQETRRLIERLDLIWDKACLSPENNNRRVATASGLQVRKKIYQGSSELWKRYRPYLNGVLDSFGIPA
jgi:tetratricopeptide (TPR) repeat protein